VWTKYSKHPGRRKKSRPPSFSPLISTGGLCTQRYTSWCLSTPDAKGTGSLMPPCSAYVFPLWASRAGPEPPCTAPPRRAPNPERTWNHISAQTHHSSPQEFKGSAREYPSLELKGHRTLGMCWLSIRNLPPRPSPQTRERRPPATHTDK